MWIVGATVLLQTLVWFVADVLNIETGLRTSPFAWVVLALVNAILVVTPAGLLAVLTRAVAPDLQGVRASARAWTAAGVCAALLGSVRAVPVPHNEVLLLITALVAAGAALILRRVLLPRGSASYGPSSRRLGFGLAAGLLVLGSWLWLGALGGVSETVLAVGAAAAVGWLGVTMLGAGFFDGFARSRPWRILVGGVAGGVTLLVLGASIGGTGVSLAEMVTLPALGFAAAALQDLDLVGQGAVSVGTDQPKSTPAAQPSWDLGWLIGIAALGPLAFVDPEETSLVLGFHDVGFWALIASGLAVIIALAVGAAYGLAPRAWAHNKLARRWASATTALVVALATTGVYTLAGHPGFHGERLFVILADQADLSRLDAIGDRPTRLRATYQRLVEHAERTQAPLRRSLDRFGLDFTPYYLVNAVRVDGGPLVRWWLSGRSDVDRVLLDQRLRPLPEPAPAPRGTASPPDGSPQWNIRLLAADRAWRELGAAGQGIVIGTSDSGVDGTHPALRNGFRGGDDSWHDPWNGTAVPTDHGGHGTHTLGSASGRGGIGVAPEARWVGCVNLDRNLGSPSRYLDCMQFMLAPFPRGGDPWRDGRPERAPHILTNSWGCPGIEGCDTAALLPATAALRAAGIFFVAAAGNTGPRCSSVDDPPAPYGDVFTVGAVDQQREVAMFSSRGPSATGATKPDIVAPGVEVLSALPGGGYGRNDGTSMATPHVAGAVALMWSANPRLIGRIDETARILRETASPVAPTAASIESDDCGGAANTAGAGVVNAYAAVRAARTSAG